MRRAGVRGLRRLWRFCPGRKCRIASGTDPSQDGPGPTRSAAAGLRFARRILALTSGQDCPHSRCLGGMAALPLIKQRPPSTTCRSAKELERKDTGPRQGGC
jgi:hypothetical protein